MQVFAAGGIMTLTGFTSTPFVAPPSGFVIILRDLEVSINYASVDLVDLRVYITSLSTGSSTTIFEQVLLPGGGPNQPTNFQWRGDVVLDPGDEVTIGGIGDGISQYSMIMSGYSLVAP